MQSAIVSEGFVFGWIEMNQGLGDFLKIRLHFLDSFILYFSLFPVMALDYSNFQNKGNLLILF